MWIKRHQFQSTVFCNTVCYMYTSNSLIKIKFLITPISTKQLAWLGTCQIAYFNQIGYMYNAHIDKRTEISFKRTRTYVVNINDSVMCYICTDDTYVYRRHCYNIRYMYVNMWNSWAPEFHILLILFVRKFKFSFCSIHVPIRAV